MSISIPQKGIGTIALTLLIISAIDSIRNLPATAIFGASLVFFLLLAGILFLIPAALMATQLASTHDSEPGIYHWARSAFGGHIGFLTIWLQWINTMVWLPTVLSFIVTTAAYLINPELANNRLYLVGSILAIFWTLTLLNLRGIEASARFSGIMTLLGMVIPLFLIIGLGALWLVKGQPISIQLTPATFFPKLNESNNWVSLTAIITAFIGIELAAVHIQDIRNPKKTFPKAMLIATLFIFISMTAGSLTLAMILPKDQINLMGGVMQGFHQFFIAYHLSSWLPLVTLMLFIGTLGSVSSWIISPAKGLLQAAQHGYLPNALTKTNRFGIAHRLLILQAIIMSVICFAFILMPSINGSYWLLTALSTQLAVMMYTIFFCAGICLYQSQPIKNGTHFKIPFGKWGTYLTGLLGIIGCIITLIVGFIPPNGIDIGSTQHYEMLFSFGLIMMILPVMGFWYWKKKSQEAGC